jgi:hypothetical protein
MISTQNFRFCQLGSKQLFPKNEQMELSVTSSVTFGSCAFVEGTTSFVTFGSCAFVEGTTMTLSRTLQWMGGTSGSE